MAQIRAQTPSKAAKKQKPKKGSSKRSRPSKYCQFNQGSAFLRNHVVRGLANQLIGHRKENEGAVQRVFLKGLIDSANDVNSQLKITRNDINNEMMQTVNSFQF